MALQRFLLVMFIISKNWFVAYDYLCIIIVNKLKIIVLSDVFTFIIKISATEYIYQIILRLLDFIKILNHE